MFASSATVRCGSGASANPRFETQMSKVLSGSTSVGCSGVAV